MEEEEELVAPKIRSFDILSATRGIKYRFKVNVLSTVGRIPNLQFGYKDGNRNFDSIIFIVMKSHPPEFPYVLQLITLEQSRGNVMMKFVDIANEKWDVQNRIVFITFKNERAIELQFRFEHDVYLFKVFLELMHYTYGDRRTVPSTQVPKLSFIHLKEMELENTKRAKKKQGSQGQGLSVNISAKRATKIPFYEIHSRDWKEHEVQQWMDHIIMTKKMAEKSTVLQRLRDEKLLFPLLGSMFEDIETFSTTSRFTETPRCTTPTSNMGPIRRLFKTLELVGNKIIDRPEEEEGENDDDDKSNDIGTVLTRIPLEIRHRISDSLDLLINFWDGQFSYAYHKAFIKFLSSLKKSSPTPIETIEKYFLLQRRHLWDVEECRDNILLALLYNESFKNVVAKWEDEFELEMQKHFSDSQIDPDIFDKLLIDFNTSHGGVKYENLCHLIYIQVKQNKLRKERKEMIAKQATLQDSIEKKHSEGQDSRDRANDNQKKIETMSKKLDTMSDTTSTVYKVIGKQIARLEENIIEIEEKVLKKNNEQIREMEKDLRRQERLLYKKKQEIVAVLDENNRYEQGVFCSRKQYRSEIKKLIGIKFKEFQAQLFQTKVKLVLAYKKEEGGRRTVKQQQQQQHHQQQAPRDNTKPEKPKSLIKDIVKEVEKVSIRGLQLYLDPIFNPDFFRFGLTHSYVLIKNLRFDWFDNGFVYVEDMKEKKKFMDKFETIACLDCDVPMINVNSTTLKNMIHQLAEEIIFWNSRIQYTSFTLSKKPLKKNCQEFTIEMLKNLGGGPMYPRTNQYLDSIKDILSVKHKEEKEIHKFRFINLKKKGKENSTSSSSSSNVQENFTQKFSKVIENFKHLVNKNKLFFRRHSDLDDFVSMLEEEDIDFAINYPGMYQVLKSFDRAYYLNQIENKNVSEHADRDKPSEKGCPFSQDDQL